MINFLKGIKCAGSILDIKMSEFLHPVLAFGV